MSDETTAPAEDVQEEAPATETAEESSEISLEDFDPDRALRTIRTQREAEKKLKAELAELKEKADAFDAAQASEAEAQKTLAEKLEEAQAEIGTLKGRIAASAVREDFARKAADFGITDVELAYLAAKEQGLLGSYDPKAGQVVGDHDFEKLAESYPGLVGDRFDPRVTGDAGIRGSGRPTTPNERFNRLVRDQMNRR